MPEQVEEELKEYSEDGVDMTLIRWGLSLTPAQRLEQLSLFMNAVGRIRALNAGGSFETILQALAEHEVEFAVVGAVAQLLQGVQVETALGLEVVHRRTPENIQRLLSALEDLDACYRLQPARQLKPVPAQLQTSARHILMTSAGPLNLLGKFEGQSYEDLAGQTRRMAIGGGFQVSVLLISSRTKPSQ